MNTDLRRAVGDDLGQIEELVSAAYGKYVARIGRMPKPMTANYHAALVEHQLWVLDGGTLLAAVLELIPGDDYLLIENVAVNPAFQGNGLGTSTSTRK
jgi:N-acetylglutamate synthase-like GNAT family acetyltransferase